MLILSRRIGEMLCIGDDIKVKVLKVERGQVKIGIDAPPDVSVDRFEIWQRKQTEPPGEYDHVPALFRPVYQALGTEKAEELIADTFNKHFGDDHG